MKTSCFVTLIAVALITPTWGQTVTTPADTEARPQQGSVGKVNDKVRLEYSDEVAKQLFGLFSDKEKPVQLTSIGGRADQEVANRYQRFLEKEGFKVVRVEVEARPSVVRKIEIRNTPGGYLVQIAPSAEG